MTTTKAVLNVNSSFQLRGQVNDQSLHTMSKLCWRQAATGSNVGTVSTSQTTAYAVAGSCGCCDCSDRTSRGLTIHRNVNLTCLQRPAGLLDRGQRADQLYLRSCRPNLGSILSLKRMGVLVTPRQDNHPSVRVRRWHLCPFWSDL